MKKRILHSIFGVALVGIIGINLNFNIDTDSGNFTLSTIFKQAIATEGESGGTIKADCIDQCTHKDNCTVNKGSYAVSGGGYKCCYSGSYAGTICKEVIVN